MSQVLLPPADDQAPSASTRLLRDAPVLLLLTGIAGGAFALLRPETVPDDATATLILLPIFVGGARHGLIPALYGSILAFGLWLGVSTLREASLASRAALLWPAALSAASLFLGFAFDRALNLTASSLASLESVQRDLAERSRRCEALEKILRALQYKIVLGEVPREFRWCRTERGCLTLTRRFEVFLFALQRLPHETWSVWTDLGPEDAPAWHLTGGSPSQRLGDHLLEKPYRPAEVIEADGTRPGSEDGDLFLRLGASTAVILVIEGAAETAAPGDLEILAVIASQLDAPVHTGAAP